MKKLYALLVIFLLGFIGNAQIVYIPDANFKSKLLFLGIDTNNDGDIQFSEASQVTSLDISNSTIADFTGINNFFGLTTLNCSSNIATSLNISGNINLSDLKCSSNQLTILELNNLPNLQHLDCSFNQILTLDVSGLTNLRTLVCSNNQISSLNIVGFMYLQLLDCANNHILSIDLSGVINLQYLSIINNQLSSIDVSSLINLNTLDCSRNQLSSLNVNGLTNLLSLSCYTNQLTSINVSGLTNLQYFVCSDNLLPSINVSGLTNLQTLGCSNNQLPSIDVSGLTNLQSLACSVNQLPSIDVSGLTNLHTLSCSFNQLPSLDVSGLTNLQILDCAVNQLPSLNLSGLTSIQTLYCQYNQLTSLNVSNLSHLQTLFCGNNPLNTLFMKNGSIEDSLDFSSNPNLEYICADEEQVASIQDQITDYAYTNCHVNSYCSFTPGGSFYTIQGNSHYDSNANGCDISDINYPNLKLSFSDGINTGNLIPDATGAYQYDVQAGTQTITPTLENQTYFNVSPTTATVTFPTSTSPFAQDFCLTANGTHNDLEIALLPITTASPGFDATYKIIYKNKGTGTQSGTVNFVFDDARLDLVSTVPSISSSATNSLSWSFSNLLPFETREITFVLNVNSPLETPAVNSGDILSYTATVVGVTDQTSIDNVSTLNQTVVNSFDPNDKTCIEGMTIIPSMVGQYVHYVIRFENDGTANAQNIVVKDIIDTTKFDVSSLIPLSGSASYTTRITNTNQVEFIFENINLPFVSGTNTGYVAFKIKTKPTLVLGNTFSNTANIYFDYNAPIVTNTATTTIATLGTQDFDFSSVFTLSPVPAKNSLTITTKQDVLVRSVNIYNTLGQLVQVIANPNETIDVSGLQSGSYFIRITSDKGSANAKFIKE